MASHGGLAATGLAASMLAGDIELPQMSRMASSPAPTLVFDESAERFAPTETGTMTRDTAGSGGFALIDRHGMVQTLDTETPGAQTPSAEPDPLDDWLVRQAG
jgi:hypothetical protein